MSHTRLRICSLCSALAVAMVSAVPASAQHGTPQTTPLDRSNLDTTCAPCTNFYQFANGGWIKRNPIPAAYSQWGSFNEIADRNTELLHGILDTVAATRTTASEPTMRKLGSFYASCMDTVRADQLGATPIANELKQIDAITTIAQARQYLIGQHVNGRYVVFNFGSVQDAKNSAEVIPSIQQGGLGLPDRDYYLKTDSESVQLRNEYVQHIAKTFMLLGESDEQANADAQKVLKIETTLAQASLTRVQMRDPVLTYNRETLADLARLAPGFDWTAYFAAQKIAVDSVTDVQEPKFLTAADSLFNVVPVADWQAYFRWHLIDPAAPLLSKAFVDEDFAFEQKLTGAKEQLPRYKKCVHAADRMMGEALGKAYVARYFPPAAKSRAMAMVKNLKAALRDRLATRTWMSDSTRKSAYQKLDAFMDKIGYPDKWMDYTTLQVTPDNSYYANAAAAIDFLNHDDISRIGKPVDRKRWQMTPPTVNAYYDPQLNEIVFPAGILQPPFFDPNADDAVNYGGMGAVIGHEMTHGFDDQGAQYDAQGNLKQWFTDADLKDFKGRTEMVATQFDHYTILDSVHVNGHLTLGENIADLGGLTIAYAAFEKSLEGKPRPPKIDGFTPEQRFFLAWAQIWRNNIRPEMARMRINTDPHSPASWRVNGPLSNMSEFAKAWGCKGSDSMVRPPDQQAHIW